jgi:hypothetical protein
VATGQVWLFAAAAGTVMMAVAASVFANRIIFADELQHLGARLFALESQQPQVSPTRTVATQAELIESCTKLAEFYAGRHDGRRDAEWKVSLGLWAAIVGAIAVLRGNTLRPWILPVVTIAYTVFWIRGVWVANTIDKNKAFHFIDQAQKLVRDPSHTVAEAPPRITFRNPIWWYGFLFNWASLFQVLATVILLFIAEEYLGQARPN